MSKPHAINMEEFEAVFQAALPAAMQLTEDKARQVAKKANAQGLSLAAGMVGAPYMTALNVSGVQTTFCNSWPKIDKILKMALGVLAWWPGMAPQVALAVAALTAIKKEFIPLVCPTLPPPVE